VSRPLRAEHASDAVATSTKHSSFSTAFPIYLWTERTEEVPEEDEEEAIAEASAAASAVVESSTPLADDDEEAVVEDISDATETSPVEETKPQKMKSIHVEEWVQANPHPPLWMRSVLLYVQ
jgi:heat shock protein beta